MNPTRTHPSRWVRGVYLALGLVALLLGIIGAFLPIMPTTPFILLAAACFARGSESLHRKMLANRYVGPAIRDWEEHRSMTRKAKRLAYALLALSFGTSIFLVNTLWHRLLLATLVSVLVYFLWRIPVREHSLRKTDDA